MTPVITAELVGLYRIECEGASATLKVAGEHAQLMFIQVPEEKRGKGMGRALLSAAEEEAAALGAKTVSTDYADNGTHLAGILKTDGYEFSSVGNFYSVNIGELMSSQGVKKSLRMKFEFIRTLRIRDMVTTELNATNELLKRQHYPVLPETQSRYDFGLSMVSFDGENRPMAVLLSTVQGDALVIELLLGFSKNDTQYILSVCKGLGEVLEKEVQKKKLEKIILYSCTPFVIPLITRLLDKQYEMTQMFEVIHAEKALTSNGKHLQRDFRDDAAVPMWQTEADAIFGQRNITEKALWLAEKQ